MITTTREMRIAHLEIHGWVPMKNRGTDRCGIYNENIGIGFSVSFQNQPGVVKQWARDHAFQSYEACSWDEVTARHLDAIDARLNAV